MTLYPFTGWRRTLMWVLLLPATAWVWLIWLATGHTTYLEAIEQPSRRNLWQRICWVAAGAPDDEGPRL